MIFDSTSLIMFSQGSGCCGASGGRRGLKYPGPTSGVTLRLWILLMNSQMYSTISLPRIRNSWISMTIRSILEKTLNAMIYFSQLSQVSSTFYLPRYLSQLILITSNHNNFYILLIFFFRSYTILVVEQK